MNLDIRTLVFILSLTGITQVVALFIQYRVDKTYRGVGWWLLGSAFMALGFVLLSLGPMKTIGVLALFGNPLLMLGRICLFVGTVRFIGKSERAWMTIGAFVGFTVLYYYYWFGQDNVSGRTIVISSAVALFSMAIAYNLLFSNTKHFSGSARFTATIFIIHACYLISVIFYTLFSRPIHSYVEYSPVQIAVFIIPTITSTLWTFGFILMVNQRLSAMYREEKGNLQQIFNTSPDASMITRLKDGLFVDVNLGFEAMSGYTRAEVIGKSTIVINIWQHPADRQHLVAALKEHGFCENLELEFRRKDGSQVVGMTSAKMIAIRGLPHVISVVRDISERKLAEAALRESEETYRSILNASPDDITITDLEGRILLVSPAAHAMFGYEPGEELSSQLLDFVVPEDRERARSNIGRMHQGGHPAPNEYRGLKKDGSVFDIDVKSGFIRDIHDQPSKMVFVVRDISGRKQAEADKARLEAQNRQLQKAESLSRMAGAIAHHFNNKLQSVLASLELASGCPDAEDPAKYLLMAKQATQRAAAVSMQMLVYLGQTSSQQEPRFLADLCQDCAILLQGWLPATLSLDVDCPSPGPVISANADQIHQILTNVVANAWEAMDETRGCIRISLSSCPAAAIPTTHRFPIDWQPQGAAFACLEVADTGCGIAPADIEKLFDPFFSTKFTGRGLGLPVVLGMVQAHGGAITVESTQGRGSVFRLYFPELSDAMPRLPEAGVQASEPAGGGTVLLVDDDEFMLLSTGAMIEMIGFAVLTAKGGVEAVDVFRQHQADIRCVITDLTMPQMDGWETLSALRQLEPARPVILASGYDKAQVLSSTHPDRPQAYLSKPFGLQELRDALGQALGVQQKV